jgi:hypothetical protein
MMRWLISTQTFWIMLSAVGEVGAFLTILGYLIAYEVRLWPSHPFMLRRKILIAHRQLDMRRFHTDTQFKATYLSEASHGAGSTILKFRNIILRIGEFIKKDHVLRLVIHACTGLYPLVSCLLNISTSIIDIYQTKNPESSELVRLLHILSHPFKPH